VSRCNFDILPFGKMLPQVLKLLISLKWIGYRHEVVIPIYPMVMHYPFQGSRGCL